MYRKFLEAQLDEWPLAAKNYSELSQVCSKELLINDIRFRVQCNPNRIQSTSANISKEAIQKRACFLCAENRPAEQRSLTVEGFSVLVNPFPVFPRHFTIASTHKPQAISGKFGTFLAIASELNDSVLFYNGPKCGASAPDHLHFQAGNKGILPLESDFKRWQANGTYLIHTDGTNRISELRGMYRGGWLLEGSNVQTLEQWFDGLLEACRAHTQNPEEEPMLNVLAWYESGKWTCLVLPRKAHRPACYYKEGKDQLLISPASVELGGLIVAARLEDYERIQNEDLIRIFSEVSMSETEVQLRTKSWLEATTCRDQIVQTKPSFNDFGNEPLLEVGIVSAAEIRFHFPVPFACMGLAIGKPEGISAGGAGGFTVSWEEEVPKQIAATFSGSYEAKRTVNGILFEGVEYLQLEFKPISSDGAHFELSRVKIGIGFHWEREEHQSFEGNLKLIMEGEKLTAVNRVPLESYLTSVISSEMSAKASAELLKAHAVISRSWLLAQIGQKGKNSGRNPGFVENESTRIRWYDREDHTLYDVCADDHCQRYQGVTKASTPQVREAICETRGQVLTAGTEICDARFSKCCGGGMETFENCWENTPKSYLQGLSDRANQPTLPDLTEEAQAKQWILGTPEAFCRTQDKHILEQVLNNYDQETTDFYRWSVRYTTQEISELAKLRSGIDFGEILELIPVERGVSGRLIQLKVVGTKRSLILGKELEIRRTFSTSHLYSSAFVVEKTAEGFVLHGAGWGHGVGLCQIGAAVMGDQGYPYESILQHYYPTTSLTKLYE